MTTPFVGEIQLFGFAFAPYQWTICNGSTLLISQYSSLYSLIGTTYGGDGRSNFQIPNLVNRAACSQGSGPGRTARVIGETFGENAVTLTANEMPQHNHSLYVYQQLTTSLRTPAPANGSHLLIPGKTSPFLPANPTPNTTFAPAMLGPAGGNQPHENRQPFLAMNFCIALAGAFPAFN
jgi:microcystin-dependent protein